MNSIGSIIVPHWLTQTLFARGLVLDTVTSYESAQAVFSFEELVDLLAAQDLSLPLFKSEDVDATMTRLVELWIKHAAPDDHSAIYALEREARKRCSTGNIVRKRLQAEQGPANDFDATTVEISSHYETESNVVALTPEFLHMDAQGYRDLLRLLVSRTYRFGRGTRAPRTNVFKRYLDLLHLLQE